MGFHNPVKFMVWRRCSLLVVGVAGGMLAVAMLYVSVVNTQVAHSLSLQPFDYYAVEDLVPKETVSLPIEIQGTTLMAVSLSAYEGPFLEDGSDREVADIVALLVRNIGEKEVSRCYIELGYRESCLTFYGECIPAGATVLLLECSASPYANYNFLECHGWQITSRSLLDMQSMISVEERAMGTVLITNKSNKILNNICIYYKSWLSPPDILVGGIAYSVSIPMLMPGQTEALYPYHYACGYSKIVSVTVG